MKRTAKISLVSALLVPIVLLITVGIWYVQPFASHPISDSFLQKAPPPHQEWHVLIPNLERAKVFVLNRPHEPEELGSPEELATHKGYGNFLSRPMILE